MEEHQNHFLRDVAWATYAVPTCFEPTEVRIVEGSTAITRYLVDGSIFANDPILCIYAEAISLGESLDNVFIVSFGMEVATNPIGYDKARSWSKTN